MTNIELNQKMFDLVKTERKITNEILQLINLADSRKVHLELGFGSLFDWLVRGHGYSEPAAQRRIQAARLLRSVPEAADKLATGQISLSSLSRVQSAIRAQEKLDGKKMPLETKVELVNQIENKTYRETEKTLSAIFPESSLSAQLQRRNALNLDDETLSDLQKIKDILSHALPGAELEAVIKYMAKEFLKRKDPQVENKRTTSESERRRVTKHVAVADRRAVFRRDKGRCTYKDPKSGRECGSTFQVQVDHIQPKALGGGNGIENLRCLCGAHNRMLASQIFGSHPSGG